MTKLIERLRPKSPEVRADPAIGLQDWQQMFFNGMQYQLPNVPQTWPKSNQEPIGGNFEGVIQGAYRSNGVVFACMLARQKLFAEARLKYRRLNNGKTGDVWGDASLGPLEEPWPGGTTGDLLARMISHADAGGNAFVTRRGAARTGVQYRVLRPDWTVIVSAVPDREGATAIDTEIIGYAYYEGGLNRGEPEILLPEDVAHWAPIPDPLARWRGMSWLTPILREVEGDNGMREHKLSYLKNGATPNLAISFDANVSPAAADAFIDRYEQKHAGALNAYRTIFMGLGADIKSVGADMKQLDFKVVQGAGETRIASAAGVPPIIVGLSEGLQAATYSNYGQARRAFADLTMRQLWRSACAALAHIHTVPSGSELWFDEDDISFLQEDQADAAQIQSTNAQSIRTLLDAGFQPDDVVNAVMSGDLSLLAGKHSGLFSVQLVVPGTKTGGTTPDANAPGGVAKPSQPAK